MQMTVTLGNHSVDLELTQEDLAIPIEEFLIRYMHPACMQLRNEYALDAPPSPLSTF